MTSKMKNARGLCVPPFPSKFAVPFDQSHRLYTTWKLAEHSESGLSAKTVRTALRLLEEAAGYTGPLDRRPPARAKQLVPFRTVQSGPCNQVVAVTNPHCITQSGATQHYSASVVLISPPDSGQVVKAQSHR